MAAIRKLKNLKVLECRSKYRMLGVFRAREGWDGVRVRVAELDAEWKRGWGKIDYAEDAGAALEKLVKAIGGDANIKEIWAAATKLNNELGDLSRVAFKQEPRPKLRLSPLIDSGRQIGYTIAELNAMGKNPVRPEARK